MPGGQVGTMMSTKVGGGMLAAISAAVDCTTDVKPLSAACSFTLAMMLFMLPASSLPRSALILLQSAEPVHVRAEPGQEILTVG